MLLKQSGTAICLQPSGYNLDMYIAHKDLNSQVNEQANAGLQHIKSQLAYMTFDNLCFICGCFCVSRIRMLSVK